MFKLHSLFIVFFLLSSFVLGIVFFLVHHPCIDFSVLEHYNPGKPSIVLDDEGVEWTRFQVDRRESITLQTVPNHLIQAFVAAEDHAFFKHSGISWKGIIRSMLVNVYHGKIVQGASTITQQLVKLLFFDARKTFGRKVKELLSALLLEYYFTKEQILEAYLNHVYFGCGIYGVQAASQRFFGKPASEITSAQSAVLAAIVKSPAHYCPLLYPLSAQKRRDVVLYSMKQLNFISEQEYDHARNSTLDIRIEQADIIAPHLKESLRIMLEDIIGKQRLYSGGLTIKTTLNAKMQRSAQQQFSEHMILLKKQINPAIDGALICIDVETGQIKALIGGADFSTSQFNRALQAKRQLGSIFKPLIYAAAINMGMNFAQVAVDEPLQIMQENNTLWEPQNSSRRFEGTMTLARALSHSNNSISIKTLLAVGFDAVITLAEKCKLGTLNPFPSLALGCVDASLKDAAGMFNIFAHGGIYIEPHYITWIKDEWGTKIWKFVDKREQILSASVSDQVAKVLSLGMERMQKRNATKWIDSSAIGKTGTTNASRTCWFAGSTPSHTTVIYIGCDDNRSMGNNIFPVSTAFPIWLGFHRELSSAKKDFSFDPGLREIIIDNKTGERLAHARADSYSILVAS